VSRRIEIVQPEILAGTVKIARRRVDRGHPFGSARGGSHGKSPGVGKQVKHPLPGALAAKRHTVAALVEKEAGVQVADQIDAIVQSVLDNDQWFGGHGAGQQPSFDHPPRRTGLLGAKFAINAAGAAPRHEGLDNDRQVRLPRRRVVLHQQIVAISVDGQPGETVPLAVDQPPDRGVAKIKPAAQARGGRQSGIDPVCIEVDLLSVQHAGDDSCPRIEKRRAQKIAAIADEVDQSAASHLGPPGRIAIGDHPWMSKLKHADGLRTDLAAETGWLFYGHSVFQNLEWQSGIQNTEFRI